MRWGWNIFHFVFYLPLPYENVYYMHMSECVYDSICMRMAAHRDNTDDDDDDDDGPNSVITRARGAFPFGIAFIERKGANNKNTRRGFFLSRMKPVSQICSR